MQPGRDHGRLINHHRPLTISSCNARIHDINQLFFPDMVKSALVVNNNSTFSDEDFDNTQKLAGATKQEKDLKIGKFG